MVGKNKKETSRIVDGLNLDEADFAGYATKADVKCADGKIIAPDAFEHQNHTVVPLVWQHGHNDPEMIIGKAVLEHRADGAYAYAFFNGSPKASSTKGLVHGRDVKMLSIWANQLVMRGQKVLHGFIREVSVVLSGQNPGALIDYIGIAHGDGTTEILEDEAIIYTGLEFEHAASDDSDDDDDEDDEDGETVLDVYQTLNEKQKEAVHYMLSEALNEGDTAEHGAKETDPKNQNNDPEGTEMTHKNVFEKEKTGDAGKGDGYELTHADMTGIIAAAEKMGSMKAAVEGFALEHGINDIDLLFPDAKAVADSPEFFGRRIEWVEGFMNAATKRPFARIKSLHTDLTHDEARAKGYIKGTLKKEEFFRIARRSTDPTTVYKKQKLDRDDVVDITDFDVIAWMKHEMRFMLREEVARAGLCGDGREVDDEDKVDETKIRPIATDDELYTVKVQVNIQDANSNFEEVLDEIIRQRSFYRGSGLPTFYTTEAHIASMLLLRDGQLRKLYRNLDEVAQELRVKEIVAVEVLEDVPGLIGVIVNPTDYTWGANRGGEVTMFDDFDIDYNQHKYLIETRASGALTKYRSALAIWEVDAGDVLVAPVEPTFDEATGNVTITDTTGVVYKDADDVVLTNAGSPYVVAAGDSLYVFATPAAGYYFASSEDDSWVYTMPAA